MKSAPKIEIRRAGVNDAAVAAVLFDRYRQFYKQPADLESSQVFLTERLSRDESVLFIAFSASTAVGFTQLYPGFSSVRLRPSWTLNDLYVDEIARGEGVGAKLIERAIAYARETDASHLSLATAKDNPAARLYKKLGWLPNENFDHYTFRL